MVGEVIVKRVQAFATDNASTLLTGVGVVGTVTTAVLTGRASFKAAKIIDHQLAPQDISAGPITKKEIILATWPEFIPPVGVGTITIASIIYANRISAKQAAAMAAAYTLSEKSFAEYKEKVLEKMGVNKETDIRDEVAQDRINSNPPKGDIIIVGDGDVLCHDVLSGRYFKSSVEKLKRAENQANFDIVNFQGVSLSQFYDEIELMPTPFSDTVGWNVDNKCELQISTVMTDDGQPCISVDFARWPKPDYDKTWG